MTEGNKKYTVENIHVQETIDTAKKLLAEEKGLSPAFKSIVEVLLLLVAILINRLNLNSTNSSKPPSTNQFSKEKNKRSKSNNKPGGQPGHPGATLELVDNPDEIVPISVDQSTLPLGQYHVVGYKRRQVFDIRIRRWVTEYQAEIVEEKHSAVRYTAPFPGEVTQQAQYGSQVKIFSVYFSQFQLIPYERIQDFFMASAGMPISEGTVCNINQQVYEKLERFEEIVKQQLIASPVLHVDETSINVNGKRIWLHNVSSTRWTLYSAHINRGCIAMDEIGVIPNFKGILCHDHWKPYLSYQKCLHALCNAHHRRELQRAYEQDHQQWAMDMKQLLDDFNDAVDIAGGVLDAPTTEEYCQKYRDLIAQGEKECPRAVRDETAEHGKKRHGKVKQSKSRNLLERLRDYEAEVLRFLIYKDVPFTNNQGENDLRMTKVQQKISGCFRSMNGAKIFCRTRSYLSTCRKNGLSAVDALAILFDGRLPDFIQPP